MTAKTSAEMVEARKLILGGATPVEAAKATGLTPSGITRSPWYRAHLATLPPGRMDQAREMVTKRGMTAYAAAKAAGVAQSNISRSKWYRDFKNNLRE